MKYCDKKSTYLTKKFIASKIAKPRNPGYLLRTAHFPMNKKNERNIFPISLRSRRDHRVKRAQDSYIMRKSTCAKKFSDLRILSTRTYNVST